MQRSRKAIHVIQWLDRNGAINFITSKMRQGKSFDHAFMEMQRVAKKNGFIRKSSSFELVTVNSYTRMKNECMRRSENEGA
jgi:hypothetical protein